MGLVLGSGVGTPQRSAGTSRDVMSSGGEKCRIALGCCGSGEGYLVSRVFYSGFSEAPTSIV